MVQNRVMLFYDLQNFKGSVLKRDRERFIHFGRAQYTIMKLLKNLAHIPCENSDLIRTYVYTGEYTRNIISKIEEELAACKPEEKPAKQAFLDKVKRKREGQQSFNEKARSFNFFELRTYPLRYENGKIFQKGVDVQLAVDFVSHAYQNNFDVAVLCTGDIDLLESVIRVKSLGKRVVVMSHWHTTAKDIRKAADYFMDISRLTDADLDEFSRKDIKNNGTPAPQQSTLSPALRQG